ncbi:hypothetical protein [Dyella thiooxydans]|uniref:hypothetical protein n=1 Tax=Dyella thiooxydans TaxID=445710 RepID=UPI0012FC6BBC|nr:hypothetical protein [Dyella thiooxydans]
MSSSSIKTSSMHHGVGLPLGTIQDPRLSYRDLGVLIALLCSMDGNALTARDLAVQSESREGREAIRKCLSNLEGAGYIQIIRQMDRRGRWTTHRTIYDTSQLLPLSDDYPTTAPMPGNPYFGSPGVGSPGDKSKSSTSKSTSLSCNALTRRDAKKRPALILGICCWNERDEQRVTFLRAKHGDEAVTTAVTSWQPPRRKSPSNSPRTNPLPSEVEKILTLSAGAPNESCQPRNSESPAGSLLAYYLDPSEEHFGTAGS